VAIVPRRYKVLASYRYPFDEWRCVREHADKDEARLDAERLLYEVQINKLPYQIATAVVEVGPENTKV
jgi:hypothetical protein